MKRRWNNYEVHYWWESPFTAIILVGVLALVVALQ